MAVDPYVKSGGVIPRKVGGITRNIGGIANAIKKIKAGDTSGLGNSGNNYAGGGSSGGAVAAPSALDSLPKTPEIQALIDKGLLRADMAPEQILAIVGMAGQVAGVPIDIAALKAQLAQDYASTTGNILGMGADWMEQMFGANMPDVNAAAYAADPMFAQYAAGLGQQEATAGLNQATDQAWFDKQQQAMTDYYNGLMQSIAMGVGTETGGGGGGGGGGGRRGYGGGGGGGSGGDGDWGFTDPTAKFTQTEKTVDSAKQVESERWPEYQRGLLAAAEAQYGIDSPQYQYVLDTIDTSHNPDAGVEQVTNDMNSALATISAREALDENNKTWTQAAPANFEGLRGEYQRLTGNTLGDTTPEDAFQWQTEGESDVDLAGIAPGSVGAKIMELMSQAYDPSNPNALYGYAGGSNENIDKAADFFNRVLNVGTERRDAKVQSGAQRIMAALQAGLHPTNAKGSTIGAVGSGGSASYDPLSSAQQNPYTPGVPGAYSPLSSANSGSISGSGPATSQLTNGSVMAGTYSPALNQTDQGANVSPYDSDLGRPLRNLYEQLAQQNAPAPTSIYGKPLSAGTELTNMKPHPGQYSVQNGSVTVPNSHIGPVTNNAPVDVYDSDLGRPLDELMVQLGQTGGIPAGAGIDQLPPEIVQAAMRTTGGPPGITEINHELLQAGLPLLDSSGHLTDAISGYGPSGNSRQILGGNALLGMPSDFGKGGFTKPGGDPAIQQAAMSKLAGQANPESSAAISDLARAMDFLSDVHGASSEGPITGNTVYDKIIGNVAVSPQTTDQYGRPVPSALRSDLVPTMQNLSGMQKVEALRGLADANLLPQGEGQYYEAPSPELSGDALANAQMVAKIAPELRDMIRAKSTLFQPNLYSRDVVNQGSSTMTSTINQKSDDDAIIAGVGAGNLNNQVTAPDVVDVQYDDFGQPIYTDENYLGAAPGNIVDDLIGGRGESRGLKTAAIRRIAQPTAKAPLTSGKSQLKPGTGKTYTKGSDTKKSYITNTKTPYVPKNKKKYGKK